jgi:O-antigen ligase
LGIRLALLIVLSLFTFRYTSRGLHNGMWLFLITAMWPSDQVWLFPGVGMLPVMTLDRIVWLLVLLVFIVKWRQGKLDKLPPDLIEYCMCALVVVILLNMYVHKTYVIDNALSQTSGSGRPQFYAVLGGFVYPFAGYFIMRRGVRTKAQANSFLTGVGLITIYLGVIGLGEAWHQDWLVFPKYILDPKVGIHWGYVRGPFLNASWDGLAMVMGLPILLWLCFGRRDVGRWFWLLGSAVIGVTLAYVFQRAVWIGAAAALAIAVLAWPKRRLILLGLVILVAAVGGLALPKTLEERIQARWRDVENIEYRLRVGESTWAMLDDHLATGVGFYRLQSELVNAGLDPHYSSHNTPLTLWAELGLLGFLPYLLIFILLLIKSLRAYWQFSWARMRVGGLWGITAAYVILLLAVEMRLTIYSNVLFFALWGLMLGMIQRESVAQPLQDVVYQRVVRFI